MALTTPQIISIAKISEYLSANEIGRGSLFGKKLDERHPRLLYTERKSLEWMYSNEPTDDSLLEVGNYVYALCGKYGLQAQKILELTGGGQVVLGGRTNIYPIYITSIDFEPDGITYNNPYILREDELTIFVNEYSQQWLVEGAETFEHTEDGIVMNIPGFDASVNSWTILIDKINS